MTDGVTVRGGTSEFTLDGNLSGNLLETQDINWVNTGQTVTAGSPGVYYSTNTLSNSYNVADVLAQNN